MELCSVLRCSLDGNRVWEIRDTCVCVAESLHCPPETITLFIGSVPIPNKKLKKKKSRASLPHLGKEVLSFFRVLDKHIS